MTVLNVNSPFELDILHIAQALDLDKERMLEFISSGIVSIPTQQNDELQKQNADEYTLTPQNHRTGKFRLTRFPNLQHIQLGKSRH
ncbi:hypothetical protein ACFOLF_09865 [Paenibacillus sepulcri]|uniref:Translation initiation factor IF-2 N-terminal domain-containing protein n=1 Tax=Paenibacillus sepulcri TaxID=359917 RepID=A0ABS7BYI0_9BACL|nr:hypothetical protein [Paenibacillus sepulcri]